MNMNQEKSLQLIEALFNSMDNATFLNEYEAIERHIGPTVECLIHQHFVGGFLKVAKEINCESLLKLKSGEIKKPSYKGENGIYSQNDELYSERLAA